MNIFGEISNQHHKLNLMTILKVKIINTLLFLFRVIQSISRFSLLIGSREYDLIIKKTFFTQNSRLYTVIPCE